MSSEEKDMSVNFFEASEINFEKKQPFSLEWIFGRNPNLPIINMTKSKDEIVFLFASGNTVGIFCAKKNCLITLTDHIHEIVALDSDKSRRFFLTADSTVTINIWDTHYRNNEKPVIIHSIHSPFHNENIQTVAISPDAKYLVVANGKTKCTVKIWLWSLGFASSDDTLNLPSRFGMIKRLRFNQNLQESHFFLLILANGICFGTWDDFKKKLKIHVPERGYSKDINDSIYIENTRIVVSVANNGFAIIWSDVFFNEDKFIVTNNKEYVKSVKLSSLALTSISYIDGIILIAEEDGNIKLYDQDLKLLYYCWQWNLNTPISTIAPHSMNFDLKDLANICNNTDFKNGSSIVDDISIERKPLFLRDFLIGTMNGRIMSVNFENGALHEIFCSSNDYISCIAKHPIRHFLLVVTRKGGLKLFDVQSKAKFLEVQLSLIIPISLRTTTEKTDVSNADFGLKQMVTCIVYSEDGAHLMISTNRGCIYAIDPDTMIPYSNGFYRYSTNKITNMKISVDSKFLIYTDNIFKTTLLYFDGGLWKCISKGQCHNKPICDFIAFRQVKPKMSRMISIGKDMVLVEYDLKTSLKNSSLDIIRRIRYDQTAVPTAVSLVSRELISTILALGKNTLDFDFVLLIADHEMKLKFVDIDSGTVLFTFLAPLFGQPISSIEFSNNTTENFMVFKSGNMIGLQFLPIDGNQFRSIGVIASFNPIQTIKMSEKSVFAFTHGSSDYSCHMWKINIDIVKKYFDSGGVGIEPFYRMFPNGKNGTWFKKIQSVFNYLKFLNKTRNEGTEIHDGDTIHINDVIDFMRGTGVFLTEFQFKNMLKEMEWSGIEFITFEKLLKLYLNHKPVSKTKIEEFEMALKYFIHKSLDHTTVLWKNSKISLDIDDEVLFQVLTEFGESMDQESVKMCMHEIFSCE